MHGGQVIQQFKATEYREYLASGQADLEVFYEQQLAYARGVQEQVHAFASLDERVISLQASHRKGERARGEPLGRLYGVPVAVEDVIDTIDFPTAFGSPIHDGRYAVADAPVVRRLRDAGALIFGKTATSEFGGAEPGPARNPHNTGHTPGGSAGGSAAAVAAGVVPLALSSQTNGSVIRAASFCGVYGFKPSMGLLPRTGVFEQSPSLDQLGLFARCAQDLALASEIMSGDDGEDRAALGLPPRQLASVCASEPPVEPKFCFVRTPWWDQVDAEAREAYEAFVELMRGVVVTAELPALVEQAVQWHEKVAEAEFAFAMQREYRNHPARLSDSLRQRVERGMQIPVLDYLTARDRMPHAACAFDAYFEHYDAILSPAAMGSAPGGFASSGNSTLQNVWSFGGLPTLSMPLLHLSSGLPLGVQAAGSLHNDGRLLRAMRWLVNEFVNRSGS
jgi:Asp-tRNA(Asn)/Glu-tRNA(Gln) amidotransferase A subunit family amidase